VQYAQAGISELWLVDAQGSEVHFEVRLLVKGVYQQVESSAEGGVLSTLLKALCRVTLQPAPHEGGLALHAGSPVSLIATESRLGTSTRGIGQVPQYLAQVPEE
jgi:hypothetical protein